jgi:hypothetical protein
MRIISIIYKKTIFFRNRGRTGAVGGHQGPYRGRRGPSGAVGGRWGPLGAVGGRWGPLGAVGGRWGPSGAIAGPGSFVCPVLYMLIYINYAISSVTKRHL